LDFCQVLGYASPGAVAALIAVSVGFGSNFLNAIHVENRLILNNGSHRAFSLRHLGLTHVPCIVQHVSSREELKTVASSPLIRNLDLCLKHPRSEERRVGKEDRYRWTPHNDINRQSGEI